jgi:hypothetical protein
MSLTESEAIFASIRETALNDVLTAFCIDRPRATWRMDRQALCRPRARPRHKWTRSPFPGVPGGIQWRLRLSIPHIDLFTQTDALPSELTPGPLIEDDRIKARGSL